MSVTEALHWTTSHDLSAAQSGNFHCHLAPFAYSEQLQQCRCWPTAQPVRHLLK
ncbi:MAG: hypothetical protein MZV49_11060 [Rhodopseudomonas palustris]|nr:hypothetical protein [Rhodopseudomonas palustris]